jgi:hypothetical protein
LNGAPENFWCYAVDCAVGQMNHMVVRSLGWKTPFEMLYGETPDISLFRFEFYEPMQYFDPFARFLTKVNV